MTFQLLGQRGGKEGHTGGGTCPRPLQVSCYKLISVYHNIYFGTCPRPCKVFFCDYALLFYIHVFIGVLVQCTHKPLGGHVADGVECVELHVRAQDALEDKVQGGLRVRIYIHICVCVCIYIYICTYIRKRKIYY